MIKIRTVFSCILTLLTICMLSVPIGGSAYGQENSVGQYASNEELPDFSVKADAGTAYSFFSLDGYGGKVAEYESLSNSGMVGLYLDYLTPHQKVNLKGLYRDDEYGLSIGADYKGRIRLNIDSRSFMHSLDNYDIGQIAGFNVYSTDGIAAPTPIQNTVVGGVDHRNQGLAHRVKINNTKTRLLIKPFNYQSHIRLSSRIFEKKGTRQQRFLNEGCTSGCHKISRSESINWRTEELDAAIDSHLGPVELEYIRKETRFKNKNDAHKENFDLISGNRRTAGSYEHNDNSNLKSSSDTVKMHTSMTGKIVGAATYSSGTRENEDADVKVDYKNAAFDLSFAPIENLMTFFKYRHKEIDEENPGQVKNQDPSLGSFSNLSVRNPMDIKKDTFAFVSTYRKSSKHSYRGEIEHSRVRRTNTDINKWAPLKTWSLPDETASTKFKLTVWDRPSSKTKIRGSYIYTDRNHPAYATQATASHEIKLNGDWNVSPFSGFSLALVSYRGKNDEIHRIVEEDTADPPMKIDREDERDSFIANYRIMPISALNINANYAYFRNKIVTDVNLGTEKGWIVELDSAPYNAEVNQFTLGATYVISESLKIKVMLDQSISKGSFDLPVATGQSNIDTTHYTLYDTSGVGTYSSLKYVESGISLGVDYIFNVEWSSAINYLWRDYDDKKDDNLDGTVQSIMTSISRKW